MENLPLEEKQELDYHVKHIATIVYRNTEPEKLKSFEDIELLVREQLLTNVGPAMMEKIFQN